MRVTQEKGSCGWTLEAIQNVSARRKSNENGVIKIIIVDIPAIRGPIYSENVDRHFCRYSNFRILMRVGRASIKSSILRDCIILNLRRLISSVTYASSQHVRLNGRQTKIGLTPLIISIISFKSGHIYFQFTLTTVLISTWAFRDTVPFTPLSRPTNHPVVGQNEMVIRSKVIVTTEYRYKEIETAEKSKKTRSFVFSQERNCIDVLVLLISGTR
jgi:hypothetical protein